MLQPMADRVRLALRRPRVAWAGVVLAVTVVLWKVPQWQTADWRAFLSPKDLLLVENELRRTLVLLLLGVLAAAALLALWRRAVAAEHAASAAADAHRGERFTRAIAQLADPHAEVRIGGVYGLEQIAAESEAHRWPVLEVLCAFLRDRAAWDEQRAQTAALPIDVQAALMVLGRRPHGAEDGTARRRLDLRRTDLRGADLNGIDLRHASLLDAHLDGAALQGAQLEGANLRGASLRHADLVEANLRGADLREAHLESAYLVEAHLEGADLGGAQMAGAYLGGAHLEGADLGGAHLEGAYMYQAHLDGASLHGARVVGTVATHRPDAEPAGGVPHVVSAPAATGTSGPQPVTLRQRRRERTG
jgi:hypothetical protein